MHRLFEVILLTFVSAGISTTASVTEDKPGAITSQVKAETPVSSELELARRFGPFARLLGHSLQSTYKVSNVRAVTLCFATLSLDGDTILQLKRTYATTAGSLDPSIMRISGRSSIGENEVEISGDLRRGSLYMKSRTPTPGGAMESSITGDERSVKWSELTTHGMLRHVLAVSPDATVTETLSEVGPVSDGDKTWVIKYQIATDEFISRFNSNMSEVRAYLNETVNQKTTSGSLRSARPLEPEIRASTDNDNSHISDTAPPSQLTIELSTPNSSKGTKPVYIDCVGVNWHSRLIGTMQDPTTGPIRYLVTGDEQARILLRYITSKWAENRPVDTWTCKMFEADDLKGMNDYQAFTNRHGYTKFVDGGDIDISEPARFLQGKGR